MNPEENIEIKKDDGFLAIIILVIAVVLVLAVGIYLLMNKKLFSSNDNSWKESAFTPPPERAAYIEAKEKLDISKVTDLDELKKMLMRRAIQTIPILLSLQNEGSSIERLYKRGMLTDDMHFKVKELKAFVDKEFQDVQFEADELVEGWSQAIWPQAMQFYQMIQKQTESKIEEQNQPNEDDKKKNEIQKKKEKSKKDKNESNNNNATTAPVITSINPEEAKLLEAERMAKILLEEEEAERKKSMKKKSK